MLGAMTSRAGAWRAFADWIAEAYAAARRTLPYVVVCGLTSVVSMLLTVGAVLVSALSVLWVGTLLIPSAVRLLRWWAGAERRRVGALTGTPVGERYEPMTGDRAAQIRAAITDPATRHDLTWVVVRAATGAVAGVLAIGVVLTGLNAILVPAYWWALPGSQPVNTIYPVTSWAAAAPMPLIGAIYLLIAIVLIPRLAGWQANWSRMLLSPTAQARLTAQISEVTSSRAAALEAHGAELRRIERDLHDGTQNRLVAVAMHLGIVERALRRDPASALPLVLRAQDAAEDAVAELRAVVRGIYPPILAERGLDGALGALVAGCAVPGTLTVDAPNRAPAAVEAAAYFAVAEALTNVSKHSGARGVGVSVSMLTRDGEDVLVIEVNDDGHGGADESGGTGLLGVRRRAEALGGRAEVASPAGGPTLVHVELPCGS